MKIGILVLSIGNSETKNYYNRQEIGLAKALDNFFEEIKVYKLVDLKQEKSIEKIDSCRNAFIYTIPTRHIGTNGIIDLNEIDKNLDVLICFSDIQMDFPKVYYWTKKNKILFLPYIGVVESHSDSKLKRAIMGYFAKRNIKIYKKCCCLVKNLAIKEKLKDGDYNILAPVGLDLDLLEKNYDKVDMKCLKSKYNYTDDDKVLLFVGRLTEEKQPLKMIEILVRLLKKDKNYKLLMVGNGELKENVMSLIKKYGIEEKVYLMEKVPNNEMWELYRIADCFVNLNKQEIFGMAILEAMYYECKVIAWKAPGPDLIIENGISGFLVESDEEIIETILKKTYTNREAHQRIEENFTWKNTAEIISKVIKDEK